MTMKLVPRIASSISHASGRMCNILIFRLLVIKLKENMYGYVSHCIQTPTGSLKVHVGMTVA